MQSGNGWALPPFIPQYLHLAGSLHRATPPLSSSSPASAEDDKQQTMRVQTGLSTYSSACCAAFLFMCGLLLALSITAHMCSSSHLLSCFSFPCLSFPHSSPLCLWVGKNPLSPTLPVQTLRKPLQRVWAEMIYGKWVSDRRLFLSFLVPWTLSGKLCLLTQI